MCSLYTVMGSAMIHFNMFVVCPHSNCVFHVCPPPPLPLFLSFSHQVLLLLCRLPMFKPRFCTWEKTCNVCPMESGSFHLTGWSPAPLVSCNFHHLFLHGWRVVCCIDIHSCCSSWLHVALQQTPLIFDPRAHAEGCCVQDQKQNYECVFRYRRLVTAGLPDPKSSRGTQDPHGGCHGNKTVATASQFHLLLPAKS